MNIFTILCPKNQIKNLIYECDIPKSIKILNQPVLLNRWFKYLTIICRPLNIGSSTDYNIFGIKKGFNVFVDTMDNPWISSISMRIYPSSMDIYPDASGCIHGSP
jgi:hypothetical protein